MTSVLDASFIRVRAPQPCIPLGQLHRLGQTGPQRFARFVLRQKTIGADKAVAVEGFSVTKTNDVQHAVAVERVVGLKRWMQRVLGVAQVDAVQIGRDFALHRAQVVGVPLGGCGRPRTGPVGMVVVFGQGRQELADNRHVCLKVRLKVHAQAPFVVVTTKLTVVAVLPPKFKVPKVLRILDLVVAGRAADLFGRVEQHAHAGRPDRVSAADQSAAGVDRQPAADFDLTVFDGLPRFARAGQPDVVDGQILAGGEAVVHFEPVDVVERHLRRGASASRTAARTCGST